MQTRFQTFDALRFFSFMLVFLHHLPIPAESLSRLFTKSGSIGVAFFFVLSGFLITYLLLQEKIANGKISASRFLLRRILRIWPLYYAMVVFALSAGWLVDLLGQKVSTDGYTPNWLMTCLFLENYQMMIMGDHPDISPLTVMWTICVEEHFYLVWVMVLNVLPVRRLPHLVVGVILLANLTRIIYSHYGVLSLDLFSNFDYFAWGALPAILYVGRNELLIKLKSISGYWLYGYLAVISLLVFGWPTFAPQWLDLLGPTLFGVLFALLIVITLPGLELVKIPEESPFSKLGKYTYGLYLIHTIVINALIQIAGKVGLQADGFIFTLTAFVMSLGAAILSYHVFEKRFLKWKEVFRPPAIVQ